MPKDREQNAGGYPCVRYSIMHNPFGTAEYKRKEAARQKAEANAKAASEKAAIAANAKKVKKKRVIIQNQSRKHLLLKRGLPWEKMSDG